MPKKALHTYHRFLDEAGDTAFFGKGGVNIIGDHGVSKTFMLWMAKFKTNLQTIRERIIELEKSIENDPYFASVPSIQKKIQSWGFYFHATDDVPEVRKIFFDFLYKEINFSFETIVGRKNPSLFVKKHNKKENEFYADILSHLLKNKFTGNTRLVLNIAERGSSTRSHNLNLALTKAKERFFKKHNNHAPECDIQFNIQNPRTEPILAVPDYLLWSIQRVFERWETRYYDYLIEKIPLVVDLYDNEHYENWGNYYSPTNPLTQKNKVGPLSIWEGYPSTTWSRLSIDTGPLSGI